MIIKEVEIFMKLFLNLDDSNTWMYTAVKWWLSSLIL